jgi:hypothetical protein
MAKLSGIRTDPDKESSGVWVTYEDDIELKLARMNNPAFDKFLETRQGPNLGKFRKQKQTDAEQDALIKDAVAATILLDWKGIEDEDGKLVPFSKEKASELVKDPSLRDFYRFILIESSNAMNFRKAVLKEALGN